jgi:hypothetical protein
MSVIGTHIWLNGLEMLPFKETMKGVFVPVLAFITWDIILKSRWFLSLIGLFTKLRKATISFIMSVCPSIRLHRTTGLPLDGFL